MALYPERKLETSRSSWDAPYRGPKGRREWDVSLSQKGTHWQILSRAQKDAALCDRKDTRNLISLLVLN